MSQTWPAQLLDSLEQLDIKEAPHGLYGIRWAYASEGRLPTAAQIISKDKFGFLHRCGFSRLSTDTGWGDWLSFTVDGERVSLQVLDFATTKVRHFGSAFRLDKRHVKQAGEPPWELESLVPKLERDWDATYALLLIAHTVSAREIEGVLGKTTDPRFVDRYDLAYHTREWDDRYHRGFHTALHLWAPRADDADPGASPNSDPAPAE